MDARARGLVLRVSATGAQWQLRFAVNKKDRRLPLGDVDAWSIAEARDLVGRAQAMLRDRTGIPDLDWLDRRRQRAGKISAPDPLIQHAQPRALFKWTFADGRAAFLEEIARTRRAATHADYRSMLSLPDLRALEDQPLPTITRSAMATIISKVHRSGRESTAEHLVRVIRPALSH